MSSRGKARELPYAGTNLAARLVEDNRLATPLNEWVWGGATAPPSVEIPFAWLSPPLRYRPDKPINIARVTAAGETTIAEDAASAARYGTFVRDESLVSSTVQDGANLADHLVDLYADPRMRSPELRFNLLKVREDHGPSAVHRILSVRLGQRITITGAPAGVPAGSTELVVEGIVQDIGHIERMTRWSTSPVIGLEPGVVGPWLRTTDHPFVYLRETFSHPVSGAATLGTFTNVATAGTGWGVVDTDSRGNRAATFTAAPATMASNPFAIVDSDVEGILVTARLVSPTIDLSAAVDPVLRFNSDFQDYDDADFGYVEVSTNGGSSYDAPLLTLGDGDDDGSAEAAGPRYVEVSLADYVGEASVTIAFRYTGDFAWWWILDNITVFDRGRHRIPF